MSVSTSIPLFPFTSLEQMAWNDGVTGQRVLVTTILAILTLAFSKT